MIVTSDYLRLLSCEVGGNGRVAVVVGQPKGGRVFCAVELLRTAVLVVGRLVDGVVFLGV